MTIQRRSLLTGSLALASAGSFPPMARALGNAHLLPYDSEQQMRAALERWRERSRAGGGERRVFELSSNLQALVKAESAAKAAPAAPAAQASTRAASSREPAIS